MAAKRTISHPIPDGYKLCSKVTDCIHLDGPILPANADYFTVSNRSSSGLTSACRLCTLLDHYKATRGEKYLEKFFANQLKRKEELRVPEGFKRCSRGDDCVHPDGPIQPATLDYFVPRNPVKYPDGMSGICRSCTRDNARQWEFDKLSDERKAERIFQQRLADQGLRRCACGESCLTPGGPILPASTEYFRPKEGGKFGLYYQCLKCERELVRREKHPDDYDEWIVPILERQKPVPEGYKRCSCLSDCVHPEGPVLPATLEYFESRAGASDGLRDQCNKCKYTRFRQSLFDNPHKLERVRQYNRIYKQKPEQQQYRREYSRRPDQIEKRIARRKIYLQTQRGKEVATAYKQRRRARKSELEATITAELWRQILEYFDYRCAVCDEPLNGLFHTVSMDHWIPIAKGGASTPDNIVPLCWSKQAGQYCCNNVKWQRDPIEFVETEFPSQAKAILKRIDAYFEWVRNLD